VLSLTALDAVLSLTALDAVAAQRSEGLLIAGWVTLSVCYSS
jgi:hypothetical protein